MVTDIMAKLMDTYDRKARLYPATLALIPLFIVAVGHYGVILPIEKGLLSLVALFGTLYLLVSMSRELGKRKENDLYKDWDGKPTTQLLRHRDTTIDPVTKARYHAFLSAQLRIKFPSASDERDNPISADHIYESGIKWLLDQTRDRKKFNLLFNENIAYGFRRNCLGIKPLAITIAIGSLLWVILTSELITWNGLKWDRLAVLSPGSWISLAISVTMLAVWIFFLTKRTVRSAAFMYADLLLRACDQLNSNQ